MQHEPRRPARLLGRLQGAALQGQGRARVRVLRHDAAVPDQRADAVRAPDRRGRARHVRTRRSRCRPRACSRPRCRPRTSRVLLNEKRGLLAAVTGNPAFYPGIVDVYDLNEDCRNPVAAELAAGRHLRPRVGLRARRQHLLRDLDRDRQHHRGRPHQPEGPDDRGGHELQLARPDGLRRRQPRLRRRQPGPVHPRHERDPGAQAGRAVQGGLQARLAGRARSRRSRTRSRSAAAPTWPRSTSSPARRATTASPPTGRRSAPRGSSTSPTRRPEGGLQHPPRGPPAREPRGDRRRPRRAEHRAGLRGPLLQRPAPRRTRRSWPAR